ncbi:PIG-L family deacetylase [Streptomyces sp. NPDC006296]|uniref:PIG-L deacetylase family protein n=1 Tax=Streptomyces sp. NPDC006296 TaxID=3156746 RepID=UPI0033B240DF
MTQLPDRAAPADPIQAPGTDEALWRGWNGWDALTPAQLPQTGKVVVVAAHPDDEVLGFGGAMAILAERGVMVTVVSVTDGERSHPESRVVTPGDLASLRAEELRSALDVLGVGHERLMRLHVPDTAVNLHEDRIVTALAPVLRDAELVVAPWTGDKHSDHEATGRAARKAARIVGVPCRHYPIWMWHWATPSDPRVPWRAVRKVELPPRVMARKRTALEQFATQIHPLGEGPQEAAILPPAVLAHYLRPREVLFQ